MTRNLAQSDFPQQLDTGARTVNARDRWSTGFEPACVARRFKQLLVESEWIGLSEPARNRRRQPLSQGLPHIHERQSRRSQQVLQGSAHVKIEVHGFHIDGPGTTVLVIVEQRQGSMIVSHADDLRRWHAKTVLKANVGHRND